MHTPPFRLARANGIGAALGDEPSPAAGCCAPAEPQSHAGRRRVRLAELDSHLHCSVIGTCMTTSELRKLVPRFTSLDRQRATDLEIHHEAVKLSSGGGEGCKALQKALDERHAHALRRFGAARDADAVLKLWEDAVRCGDIPPAYWAVMTHPDATTAVRQAAFGEVHMLSHLVGAANRADIRRLIALEEDNAALRDKLERQQERLQEAGARHEAAIRQMREHLSLLSVRADRLVEPCDTDAELRTLRDTLAARDKDLALQASLREAAEQRAMREHQEAQAVRAQLDDALAQLKISRAESEAMERAMLPAAPQGEARHPGLRQLQGKRIVYVGGRPGSNNALKSLVESTGGQLVVHDGGIEDRKGLLAATVARADMVVFPVDCIDHDSMSTLKRVCDRHEVAYYPLRTASVASFVELTTRMGMPAQETADA
ncbi:peptidase [Burkholderiaceae bacterium 16]|nr:peptidase [Burkholderiaceae bacterium 16]